MCVYERENRADKRKQFPAVAVVEVVVACLLSFQRWNKIIIIMMMLLPPIEMKDEYNFKEAGKGLNVFLKRTWECSFFLKMGQSRPLFCLFLSFSCYNSNNTN